MKRFSIIVYRKIHLVINLPDHVLFIRGRHCTCCIGSSDISRVCVSISAYWKELLLAIHKIHLTLVFHYNKSTNNDVSALHFVHFLEGISHGSYCRKSFSEVTNVTYHIVYISMCLNSISHAFDSPWDMLLVPYHM